MTQTGGTGPDAEAAFASVRATGEAAEGRVRIDLDGTGDVLDVQIDSRAMRLASEDLASAVQEAFREARSRVREQLAESDPAFEVEPGDVRETLDQLQFDAERRLATFTQMADELSAKVDRML